MVKEVNEDEHLYEDKIILWEYIKYKIRDLSMEYGKERARRQRTNEKEWEKELNKIEEKLDQGTNEVEQGKLETRKTEIVSNLMELDDHRTEGLILRSQCQWLEKGEKNNIFFLRLCSKNKIKTTMNKLLKEDGTETTKPREI
jgi:hypothetical protein